MKSAKLLLIFLLFPFVFHAQKTLTGLWTGSMSNDSTAIRHDQNVEIALSQYKQKVTGYSRSTFVINDSLYFIVKSVKGTISGNICEVTDDEIISHNFPVKPEKKVRLIFTFRLNSQDSIWRMDGDWKTTKTKEYYSISGKTELKEEKNYSQSKLFPHLEELKLAEEVAFYKEAKQKSQEAIVNIEKDKPSLIADKKPASAIEEKKPGIAIKENKAEESKTVAMLSNKSKEEKKKQEEPVIPDMKLAVVVNLAKETKEEKQQMQSISVKADTLAVAKTDNRNISALKPPPQQQNQNTLSAADKNKEINKTKTTPTTVNTGSIVIAKTEEKKLAPVDIPKQTSAVNEKKEINKITTPPSVKSEPVAVAKAEDKKPVVTETPKQKPVENEEIVVAKPAEEKKNTEVIVTKPPAVVEIPKAQAIVAAVAVTERKTVANQVVNFKSDSLQLALYDNGEVDGDTVSVLLNGEIIIAKQGLKTTALRKTIYINPGDDELTMVLYAENLGKYPPNTGLLMIYDGEDRYQVRFSADLQQNAGIVFKRKK